MEETKDRKRDVQGGPVNNEKLEIARIKELEVDEDLKQNEMTAEERFGEF